MSDAVKLKRTQETAVRALAEMRAGLNKQLVEIEMSLREIVALYAREQGLPAGDYDVEQRDGELYLVEKGEQVV